MSIMIASRMSASESISTELGLNAISPDVSEDKTPIGCADLGKLFNIVFKSSSTNDSFLISLLNKSNSS